MFTWKISGFLAYFVIFSMVMNNSTLNLVPQMVSGEGQVCIEHLYVIEQNTMGQGREWGWDDQGVGGIRWVGGDNKLGMLLMKLVFCTFTREVIFLILRNLLS